MNTPHTATDKNLGNEMALLREKLRLEQIKVESMLELTQSFNLNFSSSTICEIYRYILAEKFKIKQFVLYLADEYNQLCVASHNLKNIDKLPDNAAEILQKHVKTENICAENRVFFDDLTTVIPVLHKDLPLGYLLVSKLPWANETLIYEMLSYLQSITNIVVMGNENKKLFKIKLTKEALSSELKVARAMQDLLVPQELPHTPIFKASAIYMPNKDVGGDYYDCQQLSADEWIFCVADVVGKGVPAALFMANVQANLRLLIDTTISLKTLIEQLAARIYNNTQGDKYVTMFVAKLNTKTGALEYINAGHVQPIVCYPNGKIQRLTQGTIPLGILPILPFLNIGTTHLPQGAMLMAFTDGVSEIIDLQGTMYDHEMLEKFVCQNTTLLPKAFNGALLENMKKFSAIPHFNDDVTVLTLRYDQP